MTLAQQLLAIHQALEAADLAHAFGGAIALAYWTADPRGTSDIDVNVFIAAERCEEALRSLPDEISYDESAIATIVREGQIRLWWGETPVDLFFDYGPIHAEAARHRRIVPFAGERIPVLGPVELAAFKAIFDRTRDWADIEAMLAAETLDVDALREQLSGLVDADDPPFARLDEAIRRADAA